MSDFNLNDQILDKLVSHHIGLTRITRQLIKEITDLLNQADQSILDAIEARAKVDGTITFSRVDAILKEIQGINSVVYDEVKADISERLLELARYELKYNVEKIGSMLPVELEGDLSNKVLQSIVEKELFNGASLEEWVQGMEEGRFIRIRNAIRMGVVNEEDVRDVLARIEGTAANGYRDGVLNISRRSLASILRTSTNHVANAVRGELYSKNDDIIDGEQWVSVLDDVTTDYCEEQDGTVYPLDEGPRPPAHINCRSEMVPVVMSAEDAGFDEVDLPEHVYKLMDGRPAKKLKYPGWLRRQSNDVQDSILGPQRAALYRAGLVKVGRFIDHVGTHYTVEQLSSMELPEKGSKVAPVKTAIKNIRITKNFGWKPDLPDQKDLLFTEVHPIDIGIPKSISLRNKMPPVFDQGDLGSCSANAIIALNMFIHGSNTPMLSRLQLYWNERFIEGSVKYDSGAEIRDGIKVLAKIGVCTEEEWPYKIKKFKLKPPVTEDMVQYKIGIYSRLKTHVDFTKCLTAGFPFVGGFTVYDNFEGEEISKHGILSIPSIQEKKVGGHAVCIIGFDQDFHNNIVFKNSGLSVDSVPSFMYEVRNSYGADWGDKGHFWMPAQYLEDRNLSDDFWTARRISSSNDIKQIAALKNRKLIVGFNPNHDEKGRFSESDAGHVKDFAAETDSELPYALRGINQETDEPDSEWSKNVLDRNKEQLDAIDRAMAASDTGRMVLYRGVAGDFLDNLHEGSIFGDKSFVFTSKDENAARKFAMGKKYVMRIVTKEGDKGIDLNAKGWNEPSKAWEKAVLLNRGMRFKVYRIGKKTKYIDIMTI